MKHLIGKRNPNGRFICKDPMFNEIKFRLKNADTGLTKTYTLNELIATTYRRGCFEFRGRGTGLHDKHGREIWEGDIVKYMAWEEFHEKGIERKAIVHYDQSHCGFQPMIFHTVVEDGFYNYEIEDIEVIGNRYQHPELLEEKK